MRNHVLAAAIATALATLPAAVAAYPAVAARDVNLRAGPARDYPVVAVVALGAPLEVLGCLDGYSWCDAIAGPYRGWVWAGNLSAAWQGGSALGGSARGAGIGRGIGRGGGIAPGGGIAGPRAPGGGIAGPRGPGGGIACVPGDGRWAQRWRSGYHGRSR